MVRFMFLKDLYGRDGKHRFGEVMDETRGSCIP